MTPSSRRSALLALVVAFHASAPVGTTQEKRPVRQPLPSPAEIAALPPDGGPDYNRLVFEHSPYLLQHAGNPVDWYPWGDEAFERARAEDKPIFMSIGYSTCHWCHVMEHESFEDEEVAALLNEHFVAIKVDREERPDVDTVYMSVTQAMTGHGGWPMTVLMTPDARPFFTGTYFPKTSRRGMRGMTDLLPMIAKLWETDRDKLLADAERTVAYVRSSLDTRGGEGLGADTLERCFEHLQRRFDPEYGGFGQAPKFPVPHQLLFLLTHHQRTGDPAALTMVETTLDAMARGGIWDHVGFGFARYSTDRVWLVPHFEKMLYDQALLAMASTAAWQVTGAAAYRRLTDEIFAYVLRDMTAPEGGFYSAEDADSEGEEGLFYLWTVEQLEAVLGEQDGRLFAEVYGATKQGNFNEGGATGRNILWLPQPLEEQAARLELEVEELRPRLEACRRKLFAAREKRVHPFKDDKVLTDWNGLMIAALARAARAFDEPRYADAARRAADFALATLVDEKGRLHKRWRNGEAGLPGTLEDHAFLAWGLVELYEATFDVAWLREAVRLADVMIAHFADDEGGGFFLSADDGLALFVRPKEIYDGALPSGNSVAALVLLQLARLTGRTELEERALGTLAAFSGQVAGSPSGHTLLMAAVDFATGPTYEVVVAGDPAAEDTRAMLARLQRPYLPGKVIVLRPDGEDAPIVALAPYTEDQTSRGGKATAYVCRDFACNLPTTDPAEALAQMKAARD